MIRKSFSADTKAIDEDRGIVEAIVNVGSVLDLQDDIMEPGCWNDCIKAMKAGDVSYPSVVWGHDWSIITGKVLDAEEIPPGDHRLPDKIRKAGGSVLRIVAQYNMDTQRGREAFSDVKGGYVKQWSVGFEPGADGVRFEKGVRFISKVGRWPEVSNVLIGASPGTHTVAVKALTPDQLTERRQRSAERLEQALEIYEQAKSAQNTQAQREGARFSIDTPDGPKFPINDCADVEDAWGLRGNSSVPKDKVEAHVRRAAGKLGCDGPWNSDDGGKGVSGGGGGGEVEHKEGLPDLTGDEAVHNASLRKAMDAIKDLISQELAEEYDEPNDVLRLAAIWQDLLSWAKDEAVEYTDYGSLPMQMSDYLAAGIRKLAEVEETESDEPDELPSYMRAALEALKTEKVTLLPPHQHVPDISGEANLPLWEAAFRALRR